MIPRVRGSKTIIVLMFRSEIITSPLWNTPGASEDGKISTPVRGANLIGRAIEVMSNVDGIADDFDLWPGVCGKDGQGVPVGSGSPTLRISRITVGGTGA